MVSVYSGYTYNTKNSSWTKFSPIKMSYRGRGGSEYSSSRSRGSSDYSSSRGRGSSEYSSRGRGSSEYSSRGRGGSYSSSNGHYDTYPKESYDSYSSYGKSSSKDDYRSSRSDRGSRDDYYSTSTRDSYRPSGDSRSSGPSYSESSRGSYSKSSPYDHPPNSSYAPKGYDEPSSYRGSYSGRGRGRGASSGYGSRDLGYDLPADTGDDLLASLPPDAKAALTKALVASVLKTEQVPMHSGPPSFEYQESNARSRLGFPNTEIRGRGRGRGSGPYRGGFASKKPYGSDESYSSRKRPRPDTRSDSDAPPSKEARRDGQNVGFVQLICPFCPHMKSLRFKEYKNHLMSPEHFAIINGRARKHKDVVKQLRIISRNMLDVKMKKWQEDDIDGFNSAAEMNCNSCNHVFKCDKTKVKEDIQEHNQSKIHTTIVKYRHPDCDVCKIHMRTRMLYEHHKASIEHMKKKAQVKKEDSKDEDLDSDEEIEKKISEFKKELRTKGHMDGDSKDDDGGKKSGRSPSKRSIALDEEDEDDEEDGDHGDDSGDKTREPLGLEYVETLEALFCQLCNKLFRSAMDEKGTDLARTVHCKSKAHINNYKALHPQEDEFVFPDEDEVKLDYGDEEESGSDNNYSRKNSENGK